MELNNLMKELSARQLAILNAIVNEYTETATPISSLLLVQKYFTNLSTATIRNEMAFLEKMNLIEKPHTSAGRVPSILGYQIYNLQKLSVPIEISVKERLTRILHDRRKSIDEIINLSLQLINETTSLPAVITEDGSNELLKRIDLIQTGPLSALIIIVSSSNRVIQHLITLDPKIKFNDLVTCINVLDERLIDTPLKEVIKKLDLIKDLIKNKIYQYEYFMSEIVNKIFSYYEERKNNVQTVGVKYLVKHNEFRDQDKLTELLNLLENTSIWEQIALEKKLTGKTTITYGSEIGSENLAIASTTIKLPTINKQIAIVGPTRMNYSKIKALLDFLKKEIEIIFGTNKNE
ncbi:heat-inducible transcriptional repressor HrcA [Ureaplasma canigenitalium]|uniref:heat-inducible transcriptional repressor HrcA n=1 Tax=Ureaplasma canigenitalium TaxID=42092 RepID=UPI0004E103FE|nr:heat-inducible transcriptional repressor HrcA [Ureaplasma canigenitalium]